jgi:hypothetical protein
MTMPDERYRALVEGMKLIEDLLIPQVTPRVPGPVRDRARWIMRHYPNRYELEAMSKQIPNMLSDKDFNGNKIK